MIIFSSIFLYFILPHSCYFLFSFNLFPICFNIFVYNMMSFIRIACIRLNDGLFIKYGQLTSRYASEANIPHCLSITNCP